jgi:hypothetical protein
MRGASPRNAAPYLRALNTSIVYSGMAGAAV